MRILFENAGAEKVYLLENRRMIFILVAEIRMKTKLKYLKQKV